MNTQNNQQNSSIQKPEELIQNSLTDLQTPEEDEGTFDSDDNYASIRKDLVEGLDLNSALDSEASEEDEESEMTEEMFEQFFKAGVVPNSLISEEEKEHNIIPQPSESASISEPDQIIPSTTQRQQQVQTQMTPEQQAAQVQQRQQITAEERRKESIQIHNKLLYKIKDIYPVRSKMKPRALIRVYSITSEMIKQYIKTKVKHFVPNCFVNTIVSFVKAPKSKTKGYASARISFSDKVISEACRAKNFYERLGEDDNVTFVPAIYQNIIEKFRYNKGEIDRILSNYKALSSLEDNFGIDEQFLNDIKLYVRPQRIQIDSRNSMIVFSARVESIIQDMLTNPRTKIVDGVIEIKEIYVNRNVVHFTVYVHPSQMPIENNDMVRALIENSSSAIKFY